MGGEEILQKVQDIYLALQTKHANTLGLYRRNAMIAQEAAGQQGTCTFHSLVLSMLISLRIKDLDADQELSAISPAPEVAWSFRFRNGRMH